MYIYIDKIEASKSYRDKNVESNSNYFLNYFVLNPQTVPYIQFINEGPDLILSQCQELKEYFVKATDQVFSQFPAHRKYGKYRFGNATAELTPASNGQYCLRIQTSDWDGLSDMRKIKEKIASGTLAPFVSYHEEQKPQHLLTMLQELLKERKLPAFKRFLLSLRMLAKVS